MVTVIVGVAVAAILPHVWLLLSGWPSRTIPARWGAGWDNHDVRGSAERLKGWRRRAHFAQLNGHEAFAPFAAAIILAHLAAVPAQRLQILAAAFLLLRVLHGVLYLANLSTLRSATWLAAAAVTLGLFQQALSHAL